jgi:tetratricopeptide (TPR) repeat protein
MTGAESKEPRAGLFLILSLLIVACVYATVLQAPLVWDDTILITDSDRLRSLDLAPIFLKPFWIGSSAADVTQVYYRPLTTLSFAIDYRLHGENPAGYHLTNVGLHLLASGLLFGLLRRRGLSVALTFLLTTAWALLPRLTEGAAWVSGRTDVLATTFTLAALLVHLPARPKRMLWCAFLALCALLSKEVGAGAVVALALMELGSKASVLARGRRRWLAVWPLALTCLVYAGLRVAAHAIRGDGPELALQGRALLVLEAAGRYALMLLDPIQPRSYIGRIGLPDGPFILLGAAVLIATIALLPQLRRATTETRAFLALGALALLLVLQVIPLPITVVAADRYLYLPTAALLLAIAPSLAQLCSRFRWLILALAAFTVTAGVRTFQRVTDYTDTARFWSAAVNGAPRDPGAYIGLGAVAYDAGLFPESFRIYWRGLQLPHDPGHMVLDGCSLLAAMTGQRELAVKLAARLVERAPDNAEFHLRRASIALNTLDLELARREAERAQKLSPVPGVANNLFQMVSEAHAARMDVPGATIEPSAAIVANMHALRYPELVVLLEQQIAAPSIDDALFRRALEFAIARIEPTEAERLLARYLSARRPAGAQRLIDAVELRKATAANVRSYLRQLR